MHSLLLSSLLSKNIKIKTHTTIILPVVLCGCEAWLLTLTEKRRLKVFENRVLSRIFGLRGKREQGSGENYIMGSLMTCTPHQMLCGGQNLEERDGRNM